MSALVGLLVVALLLPATAFGHAVLKSSSPAADSKLAASPAAVTLTFTEPVQLLEERDADVVDSDGTVVSTSARKLPGDARVLEVALRAGLPEGTYTVRYKIIGADSHVIRGLFVFGVGTGELEEPFIGGLGPGGPSETSPWAVSARFLELVGLGGLLGLVAFRWLIWAPALRRAPALAAGEREAVAAWGRDAYWIAFGVLALGAMLAEGYLLVVQSAGVLGVSVLAAAQDATGLSQVLGNTSIGSLVQIRGALLFGVFALGAVLFMREYGGSVAPRPAQASYGLVGTVVIAALLISVMGGVAAQGHPQVARFPAVQIGAQLVHLATVAVWITGLALVAVSLLRVPRIAPDGGPVVSAHLLARFSRLALVVVGLAILTGVIRSLAELSEPQELWETAYGRSIVFKLLLLCPIGFLAMYNRRIVTALRRVERPNRATLRRVRRMASAEFALSISIVVIASLLVAQVPGGS
ncbi:copper resistance CopC/CopD family protein [Miltoncostaea marina]|uniref:copper resistance CopC/CopD family protein n=1 Tax=Miltoncostaea marina TaxID=2843215 RepID=UPI001C3DCDC7|nr:copper resistance protein CopC [Miltoncostaea marina]